MLSTLRALSPACNKSFRINQRAFVICHGFPPRPVRDLPKLSTRISKFKARYDLPTKIQILNREFHTTNRRDIHPILALVLKPVLRVGSFLFGRAMRKWWMKKDPVERERYAAWIRERKLYFYGIFGAIFSSVFLYYLAHVEKTPITNRRRFIMFTKEQEVEFEKLLLQTHLEQNKAHLLSENHPIYRELLAVTSRLLNANKDFEYIRDKKWTLNVIDLPARNAYVLPGGNIFIFSGILNMVENGDQLSFVIAHEIAHALLNHTTEQVSRGFLTDVLITIPIIIIWSIFPDLAAALLHLLGQQFLTVLHELPYSRTLETEADEVGLMLAAKACVDVREAVVFWGLMRSLKELNAEPTDMDWLSTHPEHENREKNLDAEMPKAIALRSSLQCPRLDPIDPRKKFYERSAKEIEAQFKRRGVI